MKPLSKSEIRAQLLAHKPTSEDESRNYLTNLPGTNSLPVGHNDAKRLPNEAPLDGTTKSLGIESLLNENVDPIIFTPFDQVKVPEEVKKQLGKPRPSPPMKQPKYKKAKR